MDAPVAVRRKIKVKLQQLELRNNEWQSSVIPLFSAVNKRTLDVTIFKQCTPSVCIVLIYTSTNLSISFTHFSTNNLNYV
jgi:hypothetical protein